MIEEHNKTYLNNEYQDKWNFDRDKYHRFIKQKSHKMLSNMFHHATT